MTKYLPSAEQSVVEGLLVLASSSVETCPCNTWHGSDQASQRVRIKRASGLNYSLTPKMYVYF